MAAANPKRAPQPSEALLDAIQDGLADLGEYVDCDSGDYWRVPFDAARRVKRIIMDNGDDPRRYRPEAFQDVVCWAFDEDMLTLFLTAWDAVLYPEGYGLLDLIGATISRNAWRAPLPPEFPARLRKRGALLATHVYYLQGTTGKAFMAARTAAKILNVDKGTAAGLLRLLVKYGVLEIVNPPVMKPTNGAATRYRYIEQKPVQNVTECY